jgi:nucleotide-binding universal stress UspA family protein
VLPRLVTRPPADDGRFEMLAMPFRAIVVGTDFSSAARGAERYAALLATRMSGELLVVHALTLEQPALEAEALTRRPSAQREEAQRLLDSVLTDAPLEPQRLLCEGNAADVIRDVSDRQAPSLVVLGTHGPGNIERRLLGSTAEGVLRSIPAPVLTVGPHVPLPRSPLMFRHVLCATDYSEAARHAESLAWTWARTFGCDIDVLHVRADGAAAIRKRILERAASDDVDLIVLGAHHHSRLSMHLRTGPAFQVVIEARCPVLTVSGETSKEAQ